MTKPLYEVKTEIFEGPMELLVHLIKKNEVDIYDIPIALVTDQFLAYLEFLKTLNIDFAGDFLVMAATLTQIKSKMLLPVHEGVDDEEEDPRLELARPLLEYLQIKSAAEELAERDLLGKDTFTRNPEIRSYLEDHDGETIKVGLFELIDAFQRILENVTPEHKVDLTTERISVKERIAEIVDILEERGSVALDELFSKNITKNDIIITFLATLEMAKLNLIQVAQHIQTGIIRLLYK
jgi:segregation and condensation protein A